MPTRAKVAMARPFIKAGMSIAVQMGRLGLRIPRVRTILVRKFATINRMSEQETEETLFSKEMKETLVKCKLIYLTKEVKKGKPVNRKYKAFKMVPTEVSNPVGDNNSTSEIKPIDASEEAVNPELQLIDLANIQRPGVPLVLNFGSNS